MKVKKKQNREDVVEAVDVAEEIVGTEEETTDTADTETDAVTEAAPELAVISQSPKDQVRITMLRNIDPPPTIGHADLARILNVTRLMARESYVVPRHVADVLVDAKVAVLPS